MKTISTLALIAALSFSMPAFAQVAVDTPSVGVDAGGVSVEVGGGVTVDTGTSSSAQGGGASSSSSAQGGGNGGNASSSSSAEGSGNAMGSGSGENCDALLNSPTANAMMDPAMLDSISSVTVLTTEDCSGLTSLNAVSADTAAGLMANETVMAALTAQGAAGAEIVGYSMDGDSLTVYVRSRNN